MLLCVLLIIFDNAFFQSVLPNLLLSLEAKQLEIIEVVLKIEVEVYEIQKLLLEVKKLDEYDNFIFGNLIFMEIRFKNRLRQYYNELEELDLDISHCQFIISRFDRTNEDDT